MQKKRIRLFIFIAAIVAAVIVGGLWGRGQAYELDTRNHYGLDDDLYAMWLRADKNYSKPVALAIADSMLALAKDKGSLIGQCLALEIPIDYYNSQRYVDMDKLRQAVDRQRNFAIYVAEGRDFAFKGWAKLITRYLNQYDYNAALNELAMFKSLAQRLDNDYGYARACLLYGRIYTSMERDSLALSYTGEGIRYLERHGFNEIIYELYSDITESFIKTGQTDSAMAYIKKVEDDPNANNTALLRALFQKSVILDGRGDYYGLYNVIQLFHERLKYQQYSHAYYSNHLHQMRAIYLAWIKKVGQAYTESDSIGIEVDRLHTKVRIAEIAGLWKDAYMLAMELDSVNQANNMSQMTLYMSQQDSILKASAVEKNRQQLEIENMRMKTERLELERKNNEIKRNKLRIEKELNEQQLRQARLAAQKDSLKMLEYAAKVRKQTAEYEEREAAQKAKTLVEEKQQSVVRLVIVVLASLAIGSIVYIRYRRLYLKALKSEYVAALQIDKEKTAVIHSIRHEIRTPLNSIVGFTDLLAMADELNLSDQERLQYVEYIKQNTALLQNIIDNMISLSQLKRNNMKLKLIDANAAQIVAAAVENTRNQLPPSVELINEIPVDAKIALITDVELFRQVWENVISNACKYTSQGSIHLSYADTGTDWQFAVADTGTGIPKDKAEVVFNRFEKLGSLVQGAGLGLNFCRSVLDKLGGHISVDTSYTEGCRMVFTHPKMSPSQPSPVGRAIRP